MHDTTKKIGDFPTQARQYAEKLRSGRVMIVARDRALVRGGVTLRFDDSSVLYVGNGGGQGACRAYADIGELLADSALPEQPGGDPEWSPAPPCLMYLDSMVEGKTEEERREMALGWIGQPMAFPEGDFTAMIQKRQAGALLGDATKQQASTLLQELRGQGRLGVLIVADRNNSGLSIMALPPDGWAGCEPGRPLTAAETVQYVKAVLRDMLHELETRPAPEFIRPQDP
jgi:hypothetical protein